MIINRNNQISYWAIPSIRNNRLNPRQREAMAKDIITKVCIYYNISNDDIKGRDRHRTIVLARHMAMYIIRNRLKLKLKATGQLFNRDHTTAMHAMKSISDQIETDELIANDLDNLINIL